MLLVTSPSRLTRHFLLWYCLVVSSLACDNGSGREGRGGESHVSACPIKKPDSTRKAMAQSGTCVCVNMLAREFSGLTATKGPLKWCGTFHLERDVFVSVPLCGTGSSRPHTDSSSKFDSRPRRPGLDCIY